MSAVSLQQMWKIKKKTWPKKAPSLPLAKRNQKGRIVSSPKDIIHTLHKEYSDRLRRKKCI
jgi:hypothetical protein